jgi:short-subunit dehydrogenase
MARCFSGRAVARHRFFARGPFEFQEGFMATVFLTGASSGIGLATAEYLAEKGYQVFGTTRSLEKRTALINAMKAKHGGRLEFVAMDVTQDASVKKAVEAVLAKAGTIDVLISNAGLGVYGSIEEMPMDLTIRQFNTNVFGALRVIQAVLPGMRAKRSGRIVILSSIAGILAIPYQAHYSASKYALEAFTEGLRQELRGFGIKVAAVRPGDILTNFNEETAKAMPDNSPYKKWSLPCWNIIDKNMQKAPKPVLVAKVIHRILNTRNPKAHYTAADFVTGLTPILTPFMSSKLKEKVVRLFYEVDFL